VTDPKPIADELQQALDSLGRAIKDNLRTASEPEPEKKLPAKIIQLPLWPENRQAAPNAVFRSALFPALKFKEGRPFLKERMIVPSVSGITVWFTGERFDQSDLDVYLELLEIARSHPLGTECTFAAHGMLKKLGRATGYSDYKWLHSVLIRICTATVEISDHRKSFFGHLIEGGQRDELTRHYKIIINPKFAAVFGYGMWSSINREQRRELGRNATAKALHAYYSTHAAPGAHRFETLAEIVGLEDKKKRRARARLVEAHELLASQEVGFLRDYAVSKDGSSIKVHIHPTPGQARHIVKKAIEHRRKKRSEEPHE
jgi:hypothetical protein